MNIKKRISKFISLLLSFTITFGNVIPAYAMENTSSVSTAAIEGENISIDERDLEDVKVTYRQASSFFVTIPKTIVLDGGKQSTYSVKVSGDIDAEQCVYVAPIDGITKTENIDFYMKDQTPENAKDDVAANITHNKSHWNSAEVAEGYTQDDNLISAQGLTAGAWKGIFQTEIKLETHVTHTHNYKDGTCTICGGKCTHNFVDGRCTICGHIHNYVDGKCVCGTIDPNHTHNYKDGICTICGGKCTHNFANGTCTICGHIHNYVDGKCECGAVDPSHIHNFVDGRCTICGGKCTHNFVDGTCTICGHIHKYVDDKCECGAVDPSHVHNFVDGTCTICGHTHKYADGKCECGAVDPNHTHNYVDGTCTICGGKCTHNFVDGTCTICGHIHKYVDDKCECGAVDPNHVHNFVDGTCTICGHTHKYADGKCECGAVDPSHTHNYVDGVCTACGKTARYVTDTSRTYSNWDYTLDDTNNIITLNYYKGHQANVVVYANYAINGKTYKTQLKSNGSNATSYYMFAASGTKADPAKTMTSIVFSDVLDTSNVTNMSAMFYHCNYLANIDFGDSFDTSNVTNMSCMFAMCPKLKSLDLSRFNTGKVTDMQRMFYMYSMNSELSQIDFGDNFDTSNVTNMYRMFYNCKSLTSLDLSCFNTDRVTNMQEMFAMYSSNSLLTSVDLSSFNTGNVTNMSYMFSNAKNLKTIYVTEGKWIITQANRTKMFNKCGTSTVTYK